MQVAGTRIQRDYEALSRFSLELLGWDAFFAGEHSSPLRNHQWQRRNQISRALSRDCRRHSSRCNQPSAFPGTPSLFLLRVHADFPSPRRSLLTLTFDCLHACEAEVLFLQCRALFTEIKIIARYLKSRLFFLLSRVQFDDDCDECFGECGQSEGAVWTYGS